MFTMLCFVIQPNSVLLEIEVDQKAIGQECLDKVCRKLGIIEVDYFGLQFESHKGHLLWLNMRNEIRHQLPGLPPFRFQFKVKFFVPPHLLLQETTRHLFYLHIKQDLVKNNFACDTEEFPKLLALIVQAEFENNSWNSLKFSNYSLLFPDQDPNFLHPAIREHEKLKGISKETAEYLLIKEASKLDEYGVEVFNVKSSSGVSLQFGVGMEGIKLYDENNLITVILYSQIHLATNTGKCLVLGYKMLEDNKEFTKTDVFKLDTAEAANGLYRALTEKHAFYCCETVQDAVTSQFIRDLKGTIISIFNENTALGKKYVFDVRRTCREAYDHAKRTLYKLNAQFNDASDNTEIPLTNSTEIKNCEKVQCKALREKLARLEDQITCRVCMDAPMNTAFFPCGHILCCQQCAELCSLCPLCRTDVKEAQFIYLPINELLNN